MADYREHKDIAFPGVREVSFALETLSGLLQQSKGALAKSIVSVIPADSPERSELVMSAAHFFDPDGYQRSRPHYPNAELMLRGYSPYEILSDLDVLAGVADVGSPVLAVAMTFGDEAARNWLKDVGTGRLHDESQPEMNVVRDVMLYDIDMGPPPPQSDWRPHETNPFVYTRYLGCAKTSAEASKVGRTRATFLFEYKDDFRYVHQQEVPRWLEKRRDDAENPHVADLMHGTSEDELRVIHEAAHKLHLSANKHMTRHDELKNVAENTQDAILDCVVEDGERYLQTCVPCNVHPLRIKQFLLADASTGHHLCANAIVCDALDVMAGVRDDPLDLQGSIANAERHVREVSDASRHSLGR